MTEIKRIIEQERARLEVRGMTVIPNYDMENIVRIFSNHFIDEAHLWYFRETFKGCNVEIRIVNPQTIDIVKKQECYN